MQHVAGVGNNDVAQIAECTAALGELARIHVQPPRRLRFGRLHPQHRCADLAPAGARFLVAIEDRVDDLCAGSPRSTTPLPFTSSPQWRARNSAFSRESL